MLTRFRAHFADWLRDNFAPWRVVRLNDVFDVVLPDDADMMIEQYGFDLEGVYWTHQGAEQCVADCKLFCERIGPIGMRERLWLLRKFGPENGGSR